MKIYCSPKEKGKINSGFSLYLQTQQVKLFRSLNMILFLTKMEVFLTMFNENELKRIDIYIYISP